MKFSVLECDLAVVNESKNISSLFCSAMYFVNIQNFLTFLAMPQYSALVADRRMHGYF